MKKAEKMIDAALVRKVRNRSITFSAAFVLSITLLAFAITVHDDSLGVKLAGFFGILGVIAFGLISGSERASYKAALNGEAPYAE